MHAVAVAAKLLQSCLTLCDPTDGNPPGSPSLGFSRQEHWSGLPFPSPKHESEKWKWSCSVMSNSSQPHGLQPTRLLCPWDFPGKSTGVGSHTFSRGFSQPRDWPYVSCIAGRFFFTNWVTREAPHSLNITPASSYNQEKSCNLSIYIHISLNQAEASIIKNLKINR